MVLRMHKDSQKDCFVIAAYGLRAAQVKRFHESTLKSFNELGRRVDRISIRGPDWATKMIDFARGEAKLRRQGFDSITSITCVALCDGGKMPLVDWDAYSSISLERGSYCVMGLSTAGLVRATERMIDTARWMVDEVRPVYAIAFLGNRAEGPSLYAIGLNFGGRILAGDDYERQLAVSRWADMGMPNEVYEEGLLRDVYPWNFLTDAQLSHRAGDETLRAWIEGKPYRGVLRPFHRDVMLWEVPAPTIPLVRGELQSLGRIFDWRRHANG
jgi:hypothetical protein